MQSSLPQDLVPLGSSTLLAVISTSYSIFMAIGQAIFQRELQVNLGGVIPNHIVDSIIDPGVTSVSSQVGASELVAVIDRYSLSVTRVFVSLATTSLLTLIFSNSLAWALLNSSGQYVPAAAPVISFFPTVRVQMDLDKKQAESGGSHVGRRKNRVGR